MTTVYSPHHHRSFLVHRLNHVVLRHPSSRWEKIITNVPGGGAPGFAAGELVIECNLNPIDGFGGVLGAAGPTGIWADYPGISYQGSMVRVRRRKSAAVVKKIGGV